MIKEIKASEEQINILKQAKILASDFIEIYKGKVRESSAFDISEMNQNEVVNFNITFLAEFSATILCGAAKYTKVKNDEDLLIAFMARFESFFKQLS